MRLERNESLFDKLDEIPTAIKLSTLDNENTQTSAIDERDTFENSYYNVIAKARIIIKGHNDSRSSVASSNTGSCTRSLTPDSDDEHGNNLICGVSLLKVNSKNFMVGLNFGIHLYRIVHNNPKLNNIKKLHYLNVALIDEAGDCWNMCFGRYI